MRPAWILGALGAALVIVVVVALSRGESESKRQHCQSLANQEHAECVAELRAEEGRPAPAPEEAEAETVEEPVAEPPVEEPGGPLAYVGTIAISNKGTAFVDRYKIGPLIYPDEGMPPEEVLEACNLSYPSVLDKSVFARGEISVSYTEGSFSELMGIDAENTVQDHGPGMEVVAYQKDGEWLCRQEELESTSYEIRPGETWDLPIWFIAEEALSNAEPRVSTETENGWNFRFIGPNMYGDWRYSGPGAGECAGYEELYLYNRTGTTSC